MPKNISPFSPRRDASSAGAVAELLVAVDLLRLGYEVFGAINPTASCDVIALARSGRTIRIQVKAARANAHGTPQPRFTPSPEDRSADVWAYVTAAGAIKYSPSLHEIDVDSVEAT
jgi:hypothetical protein